MIDTDLCPMVFKVSEGSYHSKEAILSAFPPKSKQSAKKRSATLPGNGSSPIMGELTNAQRLIVAQTVGQMRSDHPVLWNGNYDQIGARRGGGAYESQSDADLAMAGYAAKALADKVSDTDELAALTEAVLGHSGLASRPKWQDRPDYRTRTISKACEDIEVQPLVDWDLSGDDRNAKAFARINRGKLLFVFKAGRWLIWKNNRWNWCDLGEEIEVAREVSRTLVKLAADKLLEGADKGKRLIREATAASMLPRLKAMLELAACETGMGASPDRLDAQPELLGVANGVVNLRFGWLMPNTPELLITQHCDAHFDKAAKCPLWLKTLNEVFLGDQATIDAFQILIGLTLTGEAGEELIVFAYGFGANGKSVVSNVMSIIIGEYAKTAPPSLLASRRTDDSSPRSDIAMLNGARLVSINELRGGMFLDEQVVKQLAGREPISARFLHKEFFSFLPRFTPWVRTNHKPIIKGDDDGIWRRIVMLPFNRRFEPHEQDPGLEKKLLAERDGILGWMIEGAKKYYQSGVKLSPTMQREQAQYRAESDMLGEFLQECTIAGPNLKVLDADLFWRWKTWCEANGVQYGSKKSFTLRLGERGHANKPSNGKRYYLGLKLASTPSFSTVQGGQD